ncbi:MAG: hypothetical protein QXE77_04320 [Desulfurococcaceae archaeon]
MIPVFRKSSIVLKEEYCSMLSADTRSGSLRAIIDKEFAPRLIKIAEESRDLSRILAEVDRYHAILLTRILEETEAERTVLAVDALARTYSSVPALLTHQMGLKPLSYFPVPGVSSIKEYLESAQFYATNPFLSKLLGYYRSLGRLKPENLVKVLDEIALIIKDSEYVHEYLAAGLYYDLILLRLCSIHYFSDAEFKSLLIPAQELKDACKLVTSSPEQIIGILKKAHPATSVASSIYEDSLKFLGRIEGLDLVAVMAPAYLASQILHVKPAESLLKYYLLYLRQSVLLKLVLVFVEEPSVKPELRLFIERWVSP